MPKQAKTKPDFDRAVSVDQLLKKKFKLMEFEGKWKDSFGTPELNGMWIAYGESGNGKTSFLLQLAKYLTNFERVAYDSMEEGARYSLQIAAERANLREVGKRLMFLDREPMPDLLKRLERPKSPKIVFLDSLQYTGLTKATYFELKERFSYKHLFIFNSHGKNGKPKGELGELVEFDADVKMLVDGFKVEVRSRYGGNKEFIIWEEGYKKQWAQGIKA